MNPFLALGELERGAFKDGARILIIGNSDSGKTTLAAAIAARTGCAVTSLDAIYWEHQAELRKRGQADAVAMARVVAGLQVWVVEGVFGWLADVVSSRATKLIWLDMPWEVCRSGLLTRGPQFGEDEAEFAQLLIWAEAYWTRTTGSSRAGHARIFADFAGSTIALTSRGAMDDFMAELAGDHTSQQTF